MKVRIYNVKDEPNVSALLRDYEMSCSNESIKLVAEDENGNIRGLCAIRFMPMIEPFISTHPKASTMLFAVTENLLGMMNAKIIRCYASEDHKELFGKVGFIEVFKDKIIMEKLLINNKEQ